MRLAFEVGFFYFGYGSSIEKTILSLSSLSLCLSLSRSHSELPGIPYEGIGLNQVDLNFQKSSCLCLLNAAIEIGSPYMANKDYIFYIELLLYLCKI